MEAIKPRLNIARATMTLLALLLLLTGAWAGDVTPEQALQEAQTFMSNRRNANGGPRYAPGAVPQLTLASKVSGLYVFNVAGNGGYIIVSNEDRTIPILGYSESGTFNAASMPANMRAWLQGYADQIAWLKQHDVQTKISTQSKNSAQKKAPRRIGSHSTNPIGPLVETKWNQDAPYWNMTPYYQKNGNNIYISKDAQSGYSHCATGCVATAMAQVMKYHEWPKTKTAEIPAYQWGGVIWLPDEDTPLSAITFDWSNMKNTYTGSETDETADAVATLMMYCGYSVQMDYGPSSGSTSQAVAYALKQYFDYKETTQFVSRSYYTAANWADLIYNELKQLRPVVYGGMSSGGGHEFVCDGYKYDNETDYFHINWGWGGQSDNYFVLSALDPDVQGIGGSSSNDGYHFGQDAVIGIQPSNGTGTVAGITPNNINLTLVSIAPSKEPIVFGESVDIVVKVKNNSSDVYDGDIMIYEENEQYDLQGKSFVITPGETKECVFTITPTATGTYSFIPLRNDFYYFENPIVTKATLTVSNGTIEVPNGLTVYDDGTTTSQYVPAFIYYFDDFTRSQFVIPATDLTEMDGGTINSISFYTTSDDIPYATESKVNVYLKEVNYTSISAFEPMESSTIVYQGKLVIGRLATGGGLMTIQFATPYEYNGGNLLIGIDNTTDAGYMQIKFYGQEVNGASVAGSNLDNLASVTPTQQNFIPKTTFLYDVPSIKKPKNVTASNVTYNSAEINWTDVEEGATAWQIVYDTSEDFNPDDATPIDVTVKPYTLTNLTPDTQYYVYVRVKKDSDFSNWSAKCTFTTPELYAKPTALAASNLTQNSATISWNGNADSYNVKYREVTVTGTAQEEVFFDSFENGIDNWTIYIEDYKSPDGMILYNITDWHLISNYDADGVDAHTGEYMAMTRSYNGNDVSVDNWLVSPQMTLGDVLKFWVIDDGSWHEHLEVWVSTGTKAISDFVKLPNIGDATGEWTMKTVDLSAYAGQTGYIAIRHNDTGKDWIFIDDFGVYNTVNTYSYGPEQSLTTTETSCSLTGLAAETMYEVQVQGDYGSEGTSGWSKIYFTTPDASAAPTDLVSSDITTASATLGWSDNQDSYNLRYRKVYFYEDFEGETLPTGWTTIDANEDGNTWSIGHATTHSGDNGAYNLSYIYGVENTTPDDYLVSPLLDLQGTLRVWLSGITDDKNAEYFSIYVSTTGNTVSDFTSTTPVCSGTTTNQYVEYTADLSSYAGQQGYIAIRHHNCTDQRYLYVDDFGLYGSENWVTEEDVDDATFTLTGLQSGIGYEWQVQGLDYDGNGHNTEWSEVAKFTTLAAVTLVNDGTDNSDIIDANNGKVCQVTLGGRTLYRDGNWNTLVLPFDLVLEGSALAGATARPLSAANIDGTTLTLAFGGAVDKLTAGTPYIIKWTSGGSNLTESDLTFSGVTINNTVRNYNNGVSGDLRVQFIGTYDAKTITTMNQNILFMGANNNLYYPDGNADTNIGACRAYFLIGSGDALAPVLTTFNIDFGDGTTEITTTNLTNYTNSDAWYTIDGRCVANGQLKMDNGQLPRGVYIHNGKKVVIK